MVSNCINVPKKVVTEKPAALHVISPICGKSEKLRNHLRKCPLVPSKIRAKALSSTGKDKENSLPSASNLAGPSNSQTQPLKKSKTGHASSAITFTSAAESQRTNYLHTNGSQMLPYRTGVLYLGKFWTAK